MTDTLEKGLNFGVLIVLGVTAAVAAVWFVQQRDATDPAEVAHLMLDGQPFGERVLQSPRPVLVDFSASWCGPCRMLKGPLAEIEAKYAGSLDVVIVDVDENRELAKAYNVSSIPALRVIVDGNVRKAAVGYHDLAGLEDLLARAGVADRLEPAPVRPAGDQVSDRR